MSLNSLFHNIGHSLSDAFHGHKVDKEELKQAHPMKEHEAKAEDIK
ncbi:hypothetical protein RJO15_20225 [Herbaspirillum huttiense F1]|nr:MULTISPECIES: hypothetical protein [Herbaspirillum]MBP1313384.1 hypothetical protein [Herbaspirillum sp. 1130]MDR6738625.1 hypothetical protein [Herbaspirillum sp. 1173]MDT0358126.1 hypothetical protein [Herbaspirillum huttiense F1]